MAKSTKQLQDELLSDSLLNQLGASEKDFASARELPILEQLLIRAAANFIIRVRENLQALGVDDTGTLSDGITQGDLIKDSQGYSISVGYPKGSKAAGYYDFVNKGVKGVKNQSVNSPYSFKTISPSRSMVGNIESWIKRNNIRANDVAITKVQAKRQSLSKMASETSKKKSLAYVVARSIKSKGLKKRPFFDNAVDSIFGKDFTTAVSKIVGQDIRVLIRQGNGNNNQ